MNSIKNYGVFNYDYTKTMFMKLFMAKPKKGGGSVVTANFEQALELIKTTDAITLGVQKIIYLIGWQYDGHDNKYPDFFEVNAALKRPQDATARESMLWLIKEAKRYNTIVSVHINLVDAYKDAPSFNEFVQANAIVHNKRGLLHAVQRYNGRACYKISFKHYWESGLFTKQFDRLLTVLPLQELGTVHVDNFQCYHQYKPDATIKQMQDARRQMIAYIRDKGIDITTEFNMREDEKLPNRRIFDIPRDHNPKIPMDTLGIIPACWWITRMTRQEMIDVELKLCCGGRYKDGYYENYLYGNMQGEDIYNTWNQPQSNWEKAFLHKFATMQVPFWFLNNYKRLSIEGRGKNEYCKLSGNVVSYNKDRKIVVGDITVKENDNLLLPFANQQDKLLAYSSTGDEREWQLIGKGYSSAKLYDISPKGKRYIGEQKIDNDKLKLKIKPQQAIFIELT